MTRLIVQWAIRHHVFTALAVAFLLFESIRHNTDAINIEQPLWGFMLSLGAYNAYRLYFQRVKLRKISFLNWPIRFKIRFLLIWIAFGIAAFFLLKYKINLAVVGTLALMFIFYSLNRIIEAPSVWLDVLGWIKAPMLALVWFCTTFCWGELESSWIEENMLVWSVNRFGLLLLVALSNDVHDREKDAERGFRTWAVRFSKIQIIYLGFFIASCMIAISIIHVGKNDWMLLTETGILHGFLGLGCLSVSYNRYQFYKHVLLMDGILITGSLVILFANYLRNLPI